MDNTLKQRSCGSSNLRYSILIEVKKPTTHENLTFFPSKGELAYQAFIYLLKNHHLISIDVNFFNFFLFHGCNYLL
jgi:hypothetical protein